MKRPLNERPFYLQFTIYDLLTLGGLFYLRFTIHDLLFLIRGIKKAAEKELAVAE
jgi:hypothetical protein